MLSNVYLTLLLGVIISLSSDSVCYILALMAPTLLIIFYLAITMPRGGRRI